MSDANFPEEWLLTKFTEVLDVQGGTQPPKSQFIDAPEEGYIQLLQIRDFGAKPVPTYIPDTSKLKKCVKRDLLIGRYGASLGRICSGMEGAYNVALAKVISGNHVYQAFLKGYLESEMFQQPLALLSRSAQNGFNKDDLATFDFALPPLAEQNVIADKLDTLLAQVKTTKARLDRIPNILKHFRQSVLAAAMSGKLTETWRSGKALNAEANLKSELSFNDGKKRKIEATSSHELVRDSFSRFWVVSKFDELYRFIDYRGKTPKKSESGKRLYTAKNIKMGYLSNDPVEYLSEKDYESWMTRGFSKANDIFFVTEGHTMGCVAMNNIGSDIALAQRTLTLQPYGNVSTKFHYYFMLSNDFQKLVDLNATGSAAKGIKASKFRGLPLPFPAYEEQTEIVRRVEELFAYADTIEQKTNTALERVNKLTQSILAKAFRGELTAGWRAANPDLISGDNSAEALLEKIKAEREVLKNQPKPKRTASKKKIGSSMSNQIIKAVEALRQASEPLSGQQLLSACGYPNDSSTEDLENFFLDIRDALVRDKSIVKTKRSDDGQDWFTLAEARTQA